MHLREWLAIHLVAQQVVWVHGVRHRHAPSKVLWHLGVAHLPRTHVAAEEDDLDALVHDTRFLEQRRKRRPRPGGVANRTGEKRQAVVARALQRERDLLARASFEIVQRQRRRLLDQTTDLQTPDGWIES